MVWPHIYKRKKKKGIIWVQGALQCLHEPKEGIGPLAGRDTHQIVGNWLLRRVELSHRRMRKPLLYKRTQLNSITRSRHYFCNLKNMMKPKKKIKEKKNWRGMENGKKEREECLGASWQVSPVLGWGPLLGWRGRCIFHGEPPPAPLPRRVGLGRRVLPPAAGRETQCVGIHLHSHTWKGFWEKKELGRSRQRQELLFFLQGLDESGL